MRLPYGVFLAMCVVIFVSLGDIVGQTVAAPDPPSSAVTIHSEPPGAGVRIDGSYMGQTPLTVKAVKGKTSTIWLHRHGYIPFQCMIGPLEQDSVLVTMILTPVYGLVSVFTDGPDYWISVDGKEVGSGRIDSLQLPLGIHQLSVKDTRFEREVSDVITIDRVHHASVRATFGTGSVSRTFAGLLLPGYGQLKDGSYLKGAGLSITGAAGLVFMISAIAQHNDANGAYSDALTAYDKAPSEPLAIAARTHADRMAAEYHTARDRMRLSVGWVALVWAANAVDFILNHATEDRIEVFAGVSPGHRGMLDPEYRLSLAVKLP